MRPGERPGQQPVLGHGVGRPRARGEVVLIERHVADHRDAQHHVPEHGPAERLGDLDERDAAGGGPFAPPADPGQAGERRQDVQGDDDRHGDHQPARNEPPRAVAQASPEEIDSLNILRASLLAMKRALDKIEQAWSLAIIDGNVRIPEVAPDRQETIVKGDGKSASIAAASILAKVTRDRIMAELSLEYPQYNFQKHKGYGTKEHMAALSHYGPCPVHRKSFAPVRLAIEKHPGRG